LTLPNDNNISVVGSDVVDWLYSHVEGFADRREARKYSCNLLKVIATIIGRVCPRTGILVPEAQTYTLTVERVGREHDK